MATTTTTTTTYPKVPQSAWSKLRAKAATAPSSKFTPPTVAAILDMGSPASASTNVVSPMHRLGLIDDNGALTDRGNMWRNDGTYGEACQEILQTVYPSDLAAFTDSSGAPDRAQITTWFQHQKFGDSNARQMAATYAMIAEKKLPEPTEKEQKAQARTPRVNASSGAKAAKTASVKAAGQVTPPTPAQQANRPDIHLDFQIHIAADADGDQIERIFASMAKYLYPAT